MAAMATCTQAFAGMSLKASAKAAPAKMTVKAHIGGKSVAGKAFLSRTHRAQRLVVRAEAEEAAEAAPKASADEGVAAESEAPRPRGASPARRRFLRRVARLRRRARCFPSRRDACRRAPEHLPDAAPVGAPGSRRERPFPARVRPVDARPSRPNVRALAPRRARAPDPPRLATRARPAPVSGLGFVLIQSRGDIIFARACRSPPSLRVHLAF